MKHHLITLATCFITMVCSAQQQLNLTWGPEKKNDKDSYELGFAGRVKDHFYTLREGDDMIYITKTRISDMAAVWERTIMWSDLKRTNKSNKDLTFDSFRLFKDHFIFFFEDYHSKEDLQKMYAQKVSFEGKLVGDFTEIGARIKMRRSKDGSFQLSFSPDSANFILTTNPYYEKYINERFQFKIIDQQLKTVSSLEVTLPFNDKDFSIQTISLSKSKDIYVLAKIDIPKRDRKDDEANYYYQILKVSPSEKGKVKEFEIKLPHKYVDEIDIVLDKKDKVKCFGFYAEMQNNGRRKDGINGVFYFSLSANAVENINLKEFDSKLVEDIAGRKRANKDKGIQSTFRLKYFFDKPDGGMMALAEEVFVQVVTTRTTSSTGGTSTTTTYHYYNNSILAVNMDPAGKIIWYSHVPKSQHTVNDDRFNSFHALYVKGTVYMIYNDEQSNAITKTYEKTMINYMKSIPVVVSINESGKSDKRTLASGGKPGKPDFILKPKYADKISDNEAFFYGGRYTKGFCFFGGGGLKAQRFGLLAIK